MKGSQPTSFNSGIDKSSFPTSNSSAQDVLERLYQVGRGAYLAKIDWQVSATLKELLIGPAYRMRTSTSQSRSRSCTYSSSSWAAST